MGEEETNQKVKETLFSVTSTDFLAPKSTGKYFQKTRPLIDPKGNKTV